MRNFKKTTDGENRWWQVYLGVFVRWFYNNYSLVGKYHVALQMKQQQQQPRLVKKNFSCCIGPIRYSVHDLHEVLYELLSQLLPTSLEEHESSLTLLLVFPTTILTHVAIYWWTEGPGLGVLRQQTVVMFLLPCTCASVGNCVLLILFKHLRRSWKDSLRVLRIQIFSAIWPAMLDREDPWVICQCKLLIKTIKFWTKNENRITWQYVKT